MNRRNGFKIVCLVLVLSILGSIAGMSLWRHKEKSRLPGFMKETIEENHRIGRMRQKIKASRSQAVAVYYPHFGKAQIDDEIEQTVDEVITRFEMENEGVQGFTTLYADYESYNLNDRYGSVQISFEKQGAVNLKEVRAWTFDLKEDRMIRFRDLFPEEALEHLAFLTRSFLSSLLQTDTPPDFEVSGELLKQDKAELFLNEDELRVYLPAKSLDESQKEELIAVIPMNKLINYLQHDVRNLLGLEAVGRVVDPNRPMVALTYDDGPNRQVTPRILDALQAHDGAATFFILGSRVAAHQDIVLRMIEEGSELGNHTFGHVDLTKQSAQEILDQMAATWEAIEEVGSLDKQEKLVRPTYGAYNDMLRKTSPYPLILWSIDTRDWAHQNADRSVAEVQNHVQDGDIILMHDMYDPTAEASERVIEWLSDRGYQLVTVSELFEARGIVLEPGKIYHSAYKPESQGN